MKAIIFDFNRTLYDPDKKRLIVGCQKVLRVLCHKTKLALITTETGDRSNLIGQLGIEKFFDKILAVREKDIQSFQTCCNILGVRPKDVVVVGDRVRSEIAVGNKLGMFTIQFRNGKFAKELPEDRNEQPRVIITRLMDLLKILSDLK